MGSSTELREAALAYRDLLLALVLAGGGFLALIGGIVGWVTWNRNWGPPAFLADQISREEWSVIHKEHARLKFNQFLLQRFPLGTNEKTLTSDLLSAGFRYETAKPDEHAKLKCEPRPQIEAQGWARETCTYPIRVLRYSWGNVACGFGLSVHWATNERNQVVQIAGSYDAGCV